MEQLRYERETLSAIVSMHVAEIAELKEKGHEAERQLGRAHFICFTGTKIQIELKDKGRETASAWVPQFTCFTGALLVQKYKY